MFQGLNFTNIFCVLVYTLFNLTCIIDGTEVELTVHIDPGREECFYQSLKAEQNIEINYQVVSGGQGELDINFHFYNPESELLISIERDGDNSHSHLIEKDGDYKFCWDNYFSTFNPKTVFFSIYVEGENDWSDYSSLDAETEYEEFVNTIKEVVGKVHLDVTRVRQIQEVFRANEARDRNLAERNYVRVNLWSISQIAGMIFVGLVQVAMIRGLLDSQSKFNRIWKYLHITR